MRFSRIHFILNPAAGQDEPILSHINRVFKNSEITWDISVTKNSGDAEKIARDLIGKTDLIAVYGGDGSVSEVAGSLINTDMTMAIVPGGTANVMAKELKMPIDTVMALELLRDGFAKTKHIDMGYVNDSPFMLRVNFGIMADMITHADQELKNSLGQLAYGISTIQTLSNAQPTRYDLVIDGVKSEVSGVALCVTNSGNIGIGDYAMLPDITVTDGLLDIVLLKNADLLSLVKVAGSTLFQTDSDVLIHWKCKEVIITTERAVSIICDDCEQKSEKIHIRIAPAALKVVVPEDI